MYTIAIEQVFGFWDYEIKKDGLPHKRGRSRKFKDILDVLAEFDIEYLPQ